MYKFLVLAALVVIASAAPGGLLAPAVVASPYAAVAHSVPVATSYANTYKVSVKSPVIAAAGPIAYAAAPAYVKAAPIAYAGYHGAPLAYAAAPAYVQAAPLAYGYGGAYIH